MGLLLLPLINIVPSLSSTKQTNRNQTIRGTEGTLETKGKMPPANRALVAQAVCPASSRVSIIYVRDATLSVTTVGTISDMMVAGLT